MEEQMAQIDDEGVLDGGHHLERQRARALDDGPCGAVHLGLGSGLESGLGLGLTRIKEVCTHETVA